MNGDEFAATIETWHDFYLLAGTAAATLVGLLFVALSLRLDGSDEARRNQLRAVMGQSFQSFMTVLIVSLFLLIPGQSRNGLGWPLIGAGLAGAAVLIRGRDRPAGDYRAFIWRLASPVACHAGIVVIGVAIRRGNTDSLYWLIAIVAILLTVSTRNAWDLLTLGDVKAARPSRDPRH